MKILLNTFFGLILIAVLFISFGASNIHAQGTQYTPLAPVKQFTTNTNCNPATNNPSNSNCDITLIDYIPKVFTVAIGVAGALAVIMIMIGGIKYITSESIGGKEDGRETINNAIMGLLLAIGAYVILYTINPNMLQFNLNKVTTITPPTTPPPPPGGGTGSTMCPANVGGVNTTVPCTCTPTCVTLGTGNYASVPFRSVGNQLWQSSADRAVILDGMLGTQGISWSITEAWPPSVAHVSTCHVLGTCFDANISPPANNANPSASDVTRINVFFTFARSAGFTLIYEVKTQAEANALYAAGVRSSFRITVNPSATAGHFHVI